MGSLISSRITANWFCMRAGLFCWFFNWYLFMWFKHGYLIIKFKNRSFSTNEDWVNQDSGFMD